MPSYARREPLGRACVPHRFKSLAIVMQAYDEDEHVKEIYARFGLAV